MRFPLRSSALVLFVLTTVFAALAPAAAYHNGNVSSVSSTVADNNVVIPQNNYTGYTFSLAAGGSIQYGIQTGGLNNFDVFLFDASGLVAYRADPPQSTQAVESLLDNNQFGGVFTVGPAGSYTVVIDNVDFSGARPNGTLDVQVALVKLGSTPPGDFLGGILAIGLLICVGGIVIVVVVLFLIIYLVTHRAKPPMPPTPPYMPPQQSWPPPQQPPQGGMPPEQYPPQNP